MALLWADARPEATRANRKTEEAGRLSAGLALDRGLDLARSGRATRGLHWMAESLRIDGADPDARHLARANIAAWSGEVPRPIGSAPRSGAVIHKGILGPDGRVFAIAGQDG